MTSYDSLANALDERTIAREVGLPHDEARIRFALPRNVVDSFAEYKEVLGAYMVHHFRQCIGRGGNLSPRDASGMAQEILEQEYRRRGGTIVTAFHDARDGTNGAVRVQLDLLCESQKMDAVERYVRDAFERYAATPDSFEQKVETMRQFLLRCGSSLGSSVDVNDPARYAQSHQELIRAYVRALQSSAAIFRSL